MATKHFYYICLIGITMLGGLSILMLKYKLKNIHESKGMVFISLGLFSFATIGFYKLFDPPLPELLLSDIDRVFSVFTNIFFVAALPFFSKAFIKFREFFPFFNRTDQWMNSVFIFFAFLTAIAAVLERNIESELGKNIIIGIDAIFSTTTIGLVSYALYISIASLWSDRLSKLFIGSLLTLFPLSQLLLPLTAIFPAHFNHLYFSFLLVLLIGITFFSMAAVIYYFLSNFERKENVEEMRSSENEELQINSLNLGFDAVKKVYFIEIEFVENNIAFTERVENRKILLPFSNWVLFAIAKKLDVKLLNQDIALTKFRMVAYWNKGSHSKLSQEFLFTNDMGLFDFNIDPDVIEIENMEHLESKLIIQDALQKYNHNFASLFPNKDKSQIQATDIFKKVNHEVEA